MNDDEPKPEGLPPSLPEEGSRSGEPPAPGQRTAPLFDTTMGSPSSGESTLLSLTGKMLGDYTVLETIGAGGGGQVFKAQHRHMGRIVAIKVMLHDAIHDPMVVQRFRREVKASGKLLHPNIVTAFDAGELDCIHYLVMEYVEGRSLAEVVRCDGPMSIGSATRHAAAIAEGIAYAHKKGIVHRDVKPSNIMLTTEGQVKILDMGLARLNDMTSLGGERVATHLTGHGIVVGSVGYISPEQIVNAHHVDHRTDIYSLGCTLHYLLTGSAPYSGSFIETLVAHSQEPIPSLRISRPDAPLELDRVFQAMVAKSPDDRIQSMDEVAERLAPFTSYPSSPPVIATTDIPLRHEPSPSSAISKYVTKAVGFDLGTRQSYVSWVRTDGIPESIPNAQGSVATPTVVRFANGLFHHGNQVLEQLDEGVADVATRFVGRLGVANDHFDLAGRAVPAEVVAAVVLRGLASDARRKIGYFSHACYTVPACFGESRRHAYRSAFEIASLATLDPLNSGMGSAIYFAFMHGWLNPLRPAEPKHLLAIRYGAGSFDAAVIRVEDQHLSTLAIVGDPAFGGQLWDERILDYVAEQLHKEHGVDVNSDPIELFRLRESCEQAKQALSGMERVSVRFRAQGKSLSGTLTRNFLQKLGRDLLERLEALLEQLLREANSSWKQIDHVLLTGGTARMPLAKDFIGDLSGNPAKCGFLDPIFAPHGTALYAQSQMEPNCPTMRLQVSELTSHSIAVSASQSGQQRVSILIPRNSRLPTQKVISFRTMKDNQQSVLLNVLEGHTSATGEFTPIGHCTIADLPPGLPAATPLELEFQVAKDGLLSIFMESKATGRRMPLPIKRATGLGTDQRKRWREWLDTGMMVGEFD